MKGSRSCFLLAIVLLSLGGCVLKSEHEKTLAENARLSSELTTTTQERDSLRQQFDDTRKRATDLESRNEDLASTNQILASKTSEYSKTSVAAQQELLRLKQEKAKSEEKVEFVTKTYDDLVKSLKDEIAQGQVAIAQQGNRLTVNVAEQVLFPSGSDQIQSQGKKVLIKVVDILKQARDKQIQVEGHSDNVPIRGNLKRRFPTNWELSAARAVTVVRFLESNGLDPSRLAATGFGENRPVASNSSPEGRKKNRRIDIVLLPLHPENDPPAPKSSKR
ncbi:MAG TPA: OmpA family protein [Bdellovibrionota bacterium]|nr:OmpA family protein [Bdellovibrionota bacterium]